MMKGRRVIVSKGFSLIENIIAVGVVSAMVPTLLMTVLMSEREREKAFIEESGKQVVEALFAELPQVWAGGELVYFPEYDEFPDLGQGGAVSLLIEDVSISRTVSDPEQIYAGSSGMIATVMRVEEESHEGSEMFLITVEGPAGRSPEARRSRQYKRRYYAR